MTNYQIHRKQESHGNKRIHTETAHRRSLSILCVIGISSVPAINFVKIPGWTGGVSTKVVYLFIMPERLCFLYQFQVQFTFKCKALKNSLKWNKILSFSRDPTWRNWYQGRHTVIVVRIFVLISLFRKLNPALISSQFTNSKQAIF